jgi:xylulokinase
MLAAEAIGIEGAIDWNPIDHTVHPRPEMSAIYDDLFGLYLRAYLDSRAVTHELAERST